MRIHKRAGLVALAVSALFSSAGAMAADLPNAYYTTYGDAQVYSLGTLAYIYCREQSPTSTCTNATNTPYNIASTPGAIKDLIVIATGASGSDLNTNFSGMDNAYPTPSGNNSTEYFSTTTTTDPGQVGGSFNDLAGSWDMSAAALVDQLGANKAPVFFFNNNQLNSEVNLAAWARIWVTDATDSNNTVSGLNFYLTNQRSYNNPDLYLNPVLQHSGGGIDFNETIATTGFDGTDPWLDYTAPTTYVAPAVGVNNDPRCFVPEFYAANTTACDIPKTTDYVLSGSNYCVNATTYLPQQCGTTGASPSIKNNLGANEVAYAVLFPELNSWLAGLTDATRSNYTIHVNLRLGCEAAGGTDAPAPDAASGHCETVGLDTRSINNGYEQLFIAAFDQPARVPEPGTLALLGLALGGLGVLRRFRKTS